MEMVVINLLNGVSFGLILFLFAIGLTVTLGVMGLLNMTHGALFTVGGFVGFSVVTRGGSFWLAVLLGGIAAGIMGFIIQASFLRRLYRQLDDQVLLTLGLVYIIENTVLWIYGGDASTVSPPPLLVQKIAIGSYTFPLYRLALIVIGLIMFLVLWWLVEKTRLGAIVRAGMDDREMTVALGLNYASTCGAVFSLGAFVGGLAGFLATPVIGIVFSMSMEILLYALIVIVVGGSGSVVGTLIGAITIGIVDAFGKAWFPDLAMFTMYIVMIIVLLVKPTGIMGRKTWED